jgi:hypothetical protein
LKAGLFAQMGKYHRTIRRNSQALTYTFSNGEPIQLTQYVSPLAEEEKLRPELGLFVQDQWRIERLTLNLGLRFEYIHSYVPASVNPATRFADARSFDKVDCVPCWKDLNPRFGASYDLFGTGKTALKTSLGRYTNAQTVSTAVANNPVNAAVNQITRSWTDLNRNFVPDCDLRSPVLNGECGDMSNANFGQLNVTTHYDPDVLNGWQRRGYNWQMSAMIEHELRPNVAISAGYFRTWYGNFLVTDNLEVSPQDYDPYCLTAPADPRLSAAGTPICGLYDITPAKFGRVNNLVTFASNFGKQTERYNGLDFNVNARLPRGALLSGGVNIGNSFSSGGAFTTSSTSRCFVVDSPQELYNCDVPIPYKARLKVFGVYPLPWALQASANFQTIPGAPYSATYPAPTAEIAPTLGRNLAGRARTALVELIRPFSQFEERVNQLDVRLSKIFSVGRVRLQGNFDVYNALNASSPLSVNSTYGPRWLVPQEILDARLFKFGIQLDF